MTLTEHMDLVRRADEKAKNIGKDIEPEKKAEEPKDFDSIPNAQNFVFTGGNRYMVKRTNGQFLSIMGNHFNMWANKHGIDNSDKRFELWVQDKRAAEMIFNVLPGHKAGYYEEKGYVVKKSPVWYEGKEGDCSHSLSLIKSVFDDPNEPMQLHYLLGWAKQFRAICKQFMKKGTKNQNCQILCIIGHQDLGKSWVFNKTIAPLFGLYREEMNDISGYLKKGGEGFNLELCNSVLHVADEALKGSTDKERLAFTRAEKACCYSNGVSIEPKGKDPFSLKLPLAFVHIMNEDDDDLKAFPIIGSDADKYIGLQAKRYHKFSLPNLKEEDKNQTDKILESEREAFAWYIDNYEIPDEIQDKDTGRHLIKAWMHPSVTEKINGISRENTLLDLLDSFYKTEPDFIRDDFYSPTGRTATDIHSILFRIKESNLSLGRSIEQIANSPKTLGSKLMALSRQKNPRVFVKNHGNTNKYTIVPPYEE